MIENLTPSEYTIDSSTQVFIDNISASPGFLNYSVIKINDIIDSQNDGKVYFSIENNQFPTDTLLAIDVEYIDSSEYYWYGQNWDGSFNLTILKDNNGYGGTIINEITNEVFRIFPIDVDKSLLIEYGNGNTTCVSQPDESDSTQMNGLCDGVCAGHIDILFLVTLKAQTWLVNQGFNKSYFDILITDLKQAWINSEIPHSVDYSIESFNWDYDTDQCELDVNNLTTNSLADAARDRNGADIVVLIAPEYAPGRYMDGDACVAEVDANADKAYVLLPVNIALSKYVFAHEVAHIYGAEHEWDKNNRGTCAHAHQVNVIPTVEYPYTIVGPNQNQIILHYSDPDVYYKGVSTGYRDIVEDDHNNAGRIRLNGCKLANFKEGLEKSVLIEFIIDNDCDLSLDANIDPSPADPNYIYTWSWSYDGLFSPSDPGQFLGNGASLTVPIPVTNPCLFFFVQVIVTLNGNFVAKSVKGIRGNNCDGSACNNGSNQNISSKNIDKDEVDKTVLSQNEIRNAKIKESFLLNLYGQRVLSINGEKMFISF